MKYFTQTALALWLGRMKVGMVGGVAVIAFSLSAQLAPSGFRPVPVGHYALTNARVVVAPGTVLEDGIVFIEGNKISRVLGGGDVPKGFEIRDCEGMTIYPAFVDPYVLMALGTPKEQSKRAEGQQVVGRNINFYGLPGEERDPGRVGPGAELSVVRPEAAVVDGFSVDESKFKKLREAGFGTAQFLPEGGVFAGTGAVALLGEDIPNRLIVKPRSAMRVDLGARGSSGDEYPRSLMGVFAVIRQTLFDAQDYAGRQSGRYGYNQSLEALGPVMTGSQALVVDSGGNLNTSRFGSIADDFGLSFTFLGNGNEWSRLELIKATKASVILPLGYPRPPKFKEAEDWEEVSLEQLRGWDWAPDNINELLRQSIDVALSFHGSKDANEFREDLKRSMERGLSERDALAALTVIPARLCGIHDQVGSIESGKLANLTLVRGSFFDPKAEIAEVWVAGREYTVTEKKDKSSDSDDAKSSEKKGEGGKDERDEREEQEDENGSESDLRLANHPNKNRGPLASPKAVLIRDATVWTNGPEGVLEGADIAIVDGRIVAIGHDLNEAHLDVDEAMIINASGKHVTPGLVDAHSHSFVMGGVNEGTLPSTSMVRIADVINSESVHLYRQLAGGLTVANALHGSANPIGGQNAILKLKLGAAPDDLLFPGAPQGIKFALGENVKQSNWGDDRTTRFPQTRMGVPVFIENRFVAGKAYAEAWSEYRENGGVRPRVNLELAAIAEIIAGDRHIHCHSYRQDEILAFLRVMEKFGVTVRTLQHCLEGYKIADEIAAHGAGASVFSDWWAYKYEVIDSIPYGGSILHERGVLVSFNSDSSDLARRMNLEAAKAMKYGGVSDVDALKFVTLFPAQQLGIDHKVGSLETGKDGDFAIWSGHPLSNLSVCLETWIEGEKYFDRALESERVAALEEERLALIEKARGNDSGESEKAEESENETAIARFFRAAMEKAHDVANIECLDCASTRVQ